MEKDKEISQIIQASQTPRANQARMEQGLHRLSQDVQSLTNRVTQSLHVTPHISHLIVHPNFVPTASSEVTLSSQCPQIFDGWSGLYTLSCGHFYHLICLITLMQNTNQCTLCLKEIPKGVYYMFGWLMTINPSMHDKPLLVQYTHYFKLLIKNQNTNQNPKHYKATFVTFYDQCN